MISGERARDVVQGWLDRENPGGLEVWAVWDGDRPLPANWHAYGAPPPAAHWIVYCGRQWPGLYSGWLVFVSKATGGIRFQGSASDEG